MMDARKQDAMTKDKIEGSASVSQLTGDAFPTGAEVEVKISSEGFYDSWYEAKVLNRYSSTRHVKYKIQYLNLLGDDGSQEPLVEDVWAKNVRPRAPRRLSTPDAGNEDEDPNIKMHDLVEAYHNDGWWHGVVSGLRNPATGLYTVSFPNSREVFQFKAAEIRPQLAFVNGKWIPVLGEAQKKETFKEGDKVEVYGLRDDYGPSYFPAQVERVIHNSYYLVKYASLNARPNGDLAEILDPQYLRPAIDCMPGKNRFMVDSHVEVFHEGGWSPGVVLSGPSGSNYAVNVESKGEPMTVHFNVSNMRLQLDWNGRRWSKWSSSPSKVKKRKFANPNKIITSDVLLTEESETTPDSVTSTGKKLKKERPEEVQELQGPSGNIFTPSCITKDLDSDNEVLITKLLRVKSKSSKNTSSSRPRIRHAVRKISQSRKLLTELKDCHSKISTGRRSSTCKRNLKGWVTDKKQDKVNHNRRTTSEKKKDVNLSNESSSDAPQPNTNGEKAAACVGTTSCQQQLSSNTNYTADHAGENAIGVSSHDRAVGHIVGSENQCLLNTQEDKVNHNRRTTSEKQKDVNLSNESSSDVPQPNTNGEKAAARVGTTSCQQQLSSNTNYTADRAGDNAIGVSSHDRAVGHIVGSESQCLLNTQDTFTDGVAKINKGQLVDSQPLNSSATMEHLTKSQDKISNPRPSRPVSSVVLPDSFTDGVAKISKGQLVDSQPLNSSATMEHLTKSQDKISNPRPSIPVSSVDQADSFTDGVAKISKGQLVDSQPLNSSATMEHLTKSQDKISNPRPSIPVSSVDQADSFTDGVAKISKGQLVDSQPLNSSATMEHLTKSQDKISNPRPSRPVSSVVLPDSFTDGVAKISKGQLVDSQPLNSSATMEHLTKSQDKISNPRPSRPVSSVVLPDSFTDGVAKISKGQLVDSQPLNSSATMEHLTKSQDKISNPSPSRPVSSVDQAAPLSLLENSVLTEPNPNSKLNKHTPVKSVTSDILLPFEKTSPLWKTIETTLKVFSCIPQMPHFMKLESECKEKREGLAIGMMVTYDSLSESIQRLSIHTEATVLEEKISCLGSLEENGFVVDPIRSRLQRLIEIKKKYTDSALKQVELETALTNKEKENTSLYASANAYEAKLENIRKSIAELKEKERAIMEERAGTLGLTVELEHSISRLREEIFSINRSNELAPEEFERVISEPLVAGCI